MIWVAFAVAAVALVVGLLIAPRLQRLPSVRQQLVGLALLGILLPLLPLLLFAAITVRTRLFTSQGIAVLVVGAVSMGVALAAALSLQRAIMGALERLSASVSSLSAGDLAVRAQVEGPEEIQQLARSFNVMAGNIQSLIESRREMTARISHDLGTPVTLLKAMLEAIADGVADSDQYLGPMQEQVNVLADLISGLLELAQIDAGQLRVHIAETALDDTIRAVAQAMGAAAMERGISISTSIEPGLTRASCDKDLVERVLLNLLTNAVRHTQPGGAVVLGTSTSGDEVRISVENSGEGVPQSSLEAVFEPFWRGASASSSGPATHARRLGLGLTIARELVVAQGGKIWAENTRGGARFTFSLKAVRRSMSERAPR